MLRRTAISLSANLLILLGTANTLQAKDSNLSFTENKGQVTDQNYQLRPDIDFRMAVPGGPVIFVGDMQVHYQWARQKDMLDKKNDQPVESYRLDVVLLGANRDAEIVSGGKSSDYDHYYLAHTGLAGARAYSYQTITYKNVYRKIDWVLYSKDNKLKYDFIVHPGGNPADIQLKYEGHTSIQLVDGGVTVTTPFGSISEGKPYSFDKETGTEIPSLFKLSGNVISFDVETKGREIVIDPAIDWVTYYGGNGDDFSKGLKADAVGNVYMSGLTKSTNNIATTGAHQTTFGGGNTDGFLVKFNASGVRQWATYYGGTSVDYFTSVTIDPSGNIYAAGVAKSTTGIATPGANMTSPAAYAELMLVKFDNAGARIWGSYANGNEVAGYTAFEGSAQLCCDANGNVFMNHTVMWGGLGMRVTKFDPQGAPYWANTWTNADFQPCGIVCDGAGNVFAIAQGWNSTTSFDVHWVKFNNSGITGFNTSFGGPDIDMVCGIDADANGDIYISGETRSTTGIATPGTARTTLAPGIPDPSGPYDGFIMKFNNSGAKQWGTYTGGIQFTGFRTSVACGAGNKLYIGGVGYYNGSKTFFNSLNSTNGTLLSAMTLPGGYAQENYMTIAYSPVGKVYICGKTDASAGFTTTGAHQATFGGGTDGFLATIIVDTTVAIDQPFNDTVHCPGNIFKLPYHVSANFGTSNTFTAYLSDASGSFASPVSIGNITSSVSDTIICTIPGAALPGNGYRVRIASTNPVFVSENNGTNMRIDAGIIPSILTYSANPGTNVGPGRTVTFSVTTSGMGATPAYQWKKNGSDISGATGSTYSGTTTIDFNTNDTITVAVTSSVACASPATVVSGPAIITVNTGISDAMVNQWQVFPNPAKDKLVLSGNAGSDVSIQVLNIAGQLVYENKARVVNGKIRKEITLDSKLANGIYLLRVTSANTTQTVRFSIEK